MAHDLDLLVWNLEDKFTGLGHLTSSGHQKKITLSKTRCISCTILALLIRHFSDSLKEIYGVRWHGALFGTCFVLRSRPLLGRRDLGGSDQHLGPPDKSSSSLWKPFPRDRRFGFEVLSTSVWIAGVRLRKPMALAF